jgi:sugar diacid utilization regulator
VTGGPAMALSERDHPSRLAVGGQDAFSGETNAEQALAELRGENQTLRRASRLQNELIELSLADRGVEALLHHLAASIENPVTLADPLFHLIASSPSEAHGDRHRRDAVQQRGTPRSVLDDPLVGAQFRRVAESRRPTLFPAFPEHGMDQRRMMAPVIASGEILGYLTVLEERPLEPVLPEMLEEASRIFAFELLHRRVALQTELHLMTDFLGDLLSGRFTDRDAVVRRAGFLGLDLFRAWTILIVEADDMTAITDRTEGQNPVLALQRLYEIVRRAAQRYAPKTIVVVQSEAIVILQPTPECERLPGAAARALANLLHDEVSVMLSPATVTISLAEACRNLEEFPLRFGEARRALEVARSLDYRCQTVSLDDFGLYGLLSGGVEENQQLRRFAESRLSPILAYDDRRGTALLETLDAYLQEGAGFRPSARRLGIHLNTLRGRLQRIEQLCDIDLSETNVRLELQVALVIHRMAVKPSDTG